MVVSRSCGVTLAHPLPHGRVVVPAAGDSQRAPWGEPGRVPTGDFACRHRIVEVQDHGEKHAHGLGPVDNDSYPGVLKNAGGSERSPSATSAPAAGSGRPARRRMTVRSIILCALPGRHRRCRSQHRTAVPARQTGVPRSRADDHWQAGRADLRSESAPACPDDACQGAPACGSGLS